MSFSLSIRPVCCTSSRPAPGYAYTELGVWDQAAADFAPVASPEGNYLYWYRLALARLATGDTDGYRDACRDMQERFAHSEAAGRLDAAVAAGEKAVTSAPESVSRQQTLGAARFGEA